MFLPPCDRDPMVRQPWVRHPLERGHLQSLQTTDEWTEPWPWWQSGDKRETEGVSEEAEIPPELCADRSCSTGSLTQAMAKQQILMQKPEDTGKTEARDRQALKKEQKMRQEALWVREKMKRDQRDEA